MPHHYLPRYFQKLVSFLFLFLLMFSSAANAAFVITSPSSDPDGTFTISWSGARSYVQIFEKQGSGWSGNPFWGGPSGSYNVSGKSQGSYDYKITECLVVGGPTGESRYCDDYFRTVVVGVASPTISAISSRTINEDSSTGPITFTVNDADTAISSLIVYATSSNVTLIPDENLVVVGTGSTRTITVTPAANKGGASSTIMLRVSDGVREAVTTFVVTVNAVNDVPTITSPGNISINEAIGTTGALMFTVGDVEMPVGSLTVSATSSNTALISPSNLILNGTGASWSVTANVIGNATGSSTITLSVFDGTATTTTSFVVTVNEFPAVLIVDANDSKGNYTLSWKYARDTIRLYERKDSGAEVDVFGGEYAPVGSKTFSKSQSGTYSYRLVDCTYVAGPTGASPFCADADTETIDVSLPIFSSSLSSSSNSSNVSSASNSSNINQLSSSSISSHASKSSQSSSASSVVMINPLLGEVLNPVNDPMSEEIYMGTLVGSQRVGDDGSFNYSLPLIIPAGINGAQPKLQLSYNSNAKNGLLGWGWSLDGLSTISRCNANMIRDGYASGIQTNDNYKYCIDGQRLVEITAGEYRTESESFLRIKKMGNYWLVTNNNGTHSRYGYNADSKLEDDQNQPYTWYLDQQKDISSNSWSVTYNKSSSGGVQTHYPYSISYTSTPISNALQSVLFHYEDRNDISTKYIAGVRVKNDKRLTKIELKSGSTTVHSYVLAYQQIGQTYHGKSYSDPAKTSRLASVKQCYGSSLLDCAAPVEFDWSSQTAANYKFTESNLNLEPSGISSSTKLYLDINGDGNLDLYTIDDTAETVEYLNGYSHVTNEPVYAKLKPSYRKADINHDGYDDVIKEFKTQTGIFVYLSNGIEISATPSPGYTIDSASVSYMAILSKDNFVPSSSEPVYNPNPQKFAYATDYADVNGDGLLDLIRSPYHCFGVNLWCKFSSDAAKDISVALNTGSGFLPFVIWYNNWSGPNLLCSSDPNNRYCQMTTYKLSFVDLNGDGIQDFLATTAYPDGYQYVMAGYNNGLGQNGGSFAVEALTSGDARNFLIGDFNGDGLVDFGRMSMKAAYQHAPDIAVADKKIAINLGVGKSIDTGSGIKGFAPETVALSGMEYVKFCGNQRINTTDTQEDYCSRTVKDFNNDGLDDILEWGGRVTKQCLEIPLPSDLKYCTKIKTTFTEYEARVYLSLGGNATGTISFAMPVVYKDLATMESISALVKMPDDVKSKTGFDDYNNDGTYEDDSRLKNNIKINRIDNVFESIRNIGVQYDTLVSDEIYQSIPEIYDNEYQTGLVTFTKMTAKRFGAKEIQVSNGIGSTNKTTYKYIGAKTHGAGYGDLGFATVEKLELVAGKTPLKTISNYYQDAQSNYKLAGRLKREVVYVSNEYGSHGALLSDTRYQWKVRVYSDDVDAGYKSPHYFSYLYQSSNQNWDLDGTLISETLTQNRTDAIQSCTKITSTPSAVVVNAGAANDTDYTADGVLFYSQSATCDESGSSASVQIKAVENLDITNKGDVRGLMQKRKQYAWAGSAIGSASKSFYDVRTQSFTYNALGQLESKTIEPELASPNSLKLTTSYLYNDYGSVKRITDTWDDVANDGLEINTRVTTIDETYDNGARKLVVTKPLNISETTQFHPWWGTPIKQTDANGLETNTFYDTQGRPERIEYADGTSTQIDYRRCSGCSPYHSNAFWYKQIKTTGSSSVRTYYDGFNREIGSRSKGLTGREVYTIQTYDSRGAPFQSTAPFYYGESQKTAATYYDALGRVSSVNHPDGSTESRGYYGLRHTTTNRLNQTQTHYLNAAGWVMKSVDNASTPVDFAYWPFGDLKTTQVNNDPKTLVSVVYDKLGRKTEMTDPNTGKTTYTYNALDLVATQTDAKNQRTCFGYDALGRQIKRVDNAGSSCTGTTQNWAYDTKTKGKGQLGSVTGFNTDGSSYSEQYSYTNYGLPESTMSSFDGNSYATTQHYDSFNRPLGVTYPTGYVAANRYNNYGHLDQVKDSTGTTLWTANDADALGNLKQFTLGNGVVTTRTYNTNTNRIESIRALSGSLVIQDQYYQFDYLGNLRSREDRKNSITQSFCYDGLNRLKAARFNGCSSAINDYNYDPLGNLTTKEGIAGSLDYGTNGSNVAGPHAVTSANYWTYQYDAIGNLITATQPGNPAKTVSYSPFNTPTSITQGSKFSTLVYGPNQDRIKHSDSNGRVTKYVGGIYEEVTKGGVTQKIHYVGDFALFISKGVNTSATYTHEYLHRDHVGSTVAISKGTMATVADISWQANGAWGERRYNQWNGPLDNLLIPTSTAKGFTDHEHLDAVGLIHMNGRVYDPELGRFMSADPFVQAPYNSQSYNRYSYVFNNPLSFTDPSGYLGCEITESFSGRDDLTGQHLGTWSQTRSGGAYCQDALDFAFDWQNQQDRQNWDYMTQNFQISYSPQNIQATGFSMAIPIEGNSFAGAGCGIVGICLGDSVEDAADLGAAEQVVGKNAMMAATVIGMIVGPVKAKAVAGGIANPVPKTLARVVPANVNPKTLGRTDDVFVTDAKVLKGLNANQIAEKLTIPQSPSGFKIIEFSSNNISGIASPINRTNPGFVAGGRTAGGAPEFVIPNGPIPVGSNWRVVQ